MSDLERRIAEAVGPLLVEGVRGVLGTDELYRLSPEYAKIKPGLPGYRRQAGKDPDQPLILTGDLYDSVESVPIAGGVRVQVAAGAAMSDKDYAAYWEGEVDYLGRGIDAQIEAAADAAEAVALAEIDAALAS